jgi:GT2 family glycosyltransferase
LLLLNPDTTLEGAVVQVLEDWLTAHPDAGVAGSRVLNADGTIQATARRFPDLTTALGGRSTWLTKHFPSNWLSRHNLGAKDTQAPVDVDWVSGVCLMTPRDLFNRLGGLDEGFFMYWEDADYCYRVREAGLRRTYVPAAAVRHPGGRSAAHNSARAIRAFHESALRLYRKHASPLGRLAAPVVGAGLWLRGRWQLQRSAAGGSRRAD